MEMPDMSVHEVKGEVAGYRWVAKYVRPSRYAVNRLSIFDPVGSQLPSIRMGEGSYGSELEMISAIEMEVSKYLSNGP